MYNFDLWSIELWTFLFCNILNKLIAYDKIIKRSFKHFHIYFTSQKTVSMASDGSRWSCAPLPGQPERAGPTLARFHRERRRGLRRGEVGGRSGVHLGDRPSLRISQRWSFCRIITRLTPPNRRIPSAQVRSGIRTIRGRSRR